MVHWHLRQLRQSWFAVGGLELSEIPEVAYDGVLCTFGITATSPSRLNPVMYPDVANPLPVCNLTNSLLFVVYVAVDMSCYFTGLYMIKKYGSSMMVIVSAVALPLQQLVFCMSFIVTTQYAETFYLSDVLALLLVCAGYYVYQWLSPEGTQGRAEVPGAVPHAQCASGQDEEKVLAIAPFEPIPSAPPQGREFAPSAPPISGESN